MSGRVPSSYGPWPGTGMGKHYVPLGQTACFKAGVACFLPTCSQGSSVPVMVNADLDVFLCFFWFLLGALCIWGVLALPVSLW